MLAAPSYFHRFSEGINPPLQLDKTRPRDLATGAVPHRRKERAVLWPVQVAQEVDAPAKASGATWAAISPTTKEIQLLNYTKCRRNNNILSADTQQATSSRITGHHVTLTPTGNAWDFSNPTQHRKWPLHIQTILPKCQERKRNVHVRNQIHAQILNRDSASPVIFHGYVK